MLVKIFACRRPASVMLYTAGMAKDKAVRALEAYMYETGLGPTEVGMVLDVDRTLIWKWGRGERRPNRKNVIGIAELTKRPVAELL